MDENFSVPIFIRMYHKKNRTKVKMKYNKWKNNQSYIFRTFIYHSSYMMMIHIRIRIRIRILTSIQRM